MPWSPSAAARSISVHRSSSRSRFSRRTSLRIALRVRCSSSVRGALLRVRVVGIRRAMAVRSASSCRRRCEVVGRWAWCLARLGRTLVLERMAAVMIAQELAASAAASSVSLLDSSAATAAWNSALIPGSRASAPTSAAWARLRMPCSFRRRRAMKRRRSLKPVLGTPRRARRAPS